jgi:hypothetical protein
MKLQFVIRSLIVVGLAIGLGLVGMAPAAEEPGLMAMSSRPGKPVIARR